MFDDLFDITAEDLEDLIGDGDCLDETMTLLNSEVKKQDHTKVEVTEIPMCDFCQREGKMVPAKYDGKTTFGPWANMCQVHFYLYGIGLGMGKGQQYVLAK